MWKIRSLMQKIFCFTKEEAGVRKYCSISEFLTLYAKTIVRYTKEEAEVRKKALAFEGGKYPGAKRVSCVV